MCHQNMLCATYLFSLAWSICEDEAQTYLFNFHFNAATFQFINFSPLVSHLTTLFYELSFFLWLSHVFADYLMVFYLTLSINMYVGMAEVAS